jgi:hypothetical protein
LQLHLDLDQNLRVRIFFFLGLCGVLTIQKVDVLK